jgi:hypothetical protein
MMNDHSNQRRSIRLKYYNYRQSGAYFVTIVTQDRRCLFGDVVNGKMRLNDPGHMVLAVWEDLSSNYLGVETDHFVAMPNHVHGVIVLVGVGARTSADSRGQPQGLPLQRPDLQMLLLPDVFHCRTSYTGLRHLRLSDTHLV